MTHAPLFSPGGIYMTPGARTALLEADATGRLGLTLIRRHVMGDWSEMSEHDQNANKRAARMGDERVFSAYTVNGARFYVITEADRSVTTILLPEEY